MSFLDVLFELATYLEAISNLALIGIVANYFWMRRWITVKLSCGTVKIRKCDLNASNLTNAVSLKFFSGEQLPADVRSEVIKASLPKTL